VADDSKTMAVLRRCPRRPRQMDAGPFEAEVGSFRLHLAAEARPARTVRAFGAACEG
jgi:hypothetical protein